MRLYLRLLLACFMLLTVAVSRADDASEQAIDDLLTLSGLKSAIEQLELAYSLSLERQISHYQLSEAQVERLTAAIASYRSEQVLEELKNEFRRGLDQNSIAPVLKTLRTDTIQKFRRFERIGHSPQQQQKLANYLPNNPVSAERLALLRNCHQSDFGPEISAILQSFAEVDTAVALDQISGEWISRNDGEGVKLWRSNIEKDYASQFAIQADPYLAFAYRFIRDETLQEYAEHWSDRNLQWFMQTSLQTLRKLLRQRRKPMLESLQQAEELPTQDLDQ